MSVEVVTVWAPRPSHEKWSDVYLCLIDLQRKSALRYGASHTIVTDDYSMRCWTDVLTTSLPQQLMPAMIAGVIARLTEAPIRSHLLFVDADCLIGRELDSAFDGTFDIGLTRRANAEGICINNGAMYVAQEGTEKAVRFFSRALARCGTHWGADQEAISAVAAPVPEISGEVQLRGDTRLAFLSMKTHGAVPKREGKPHDAHPYVIHFKGTTKPWAKTYFDQFIAERAPDGTR